MKITQHDKLPLVKERGRSRAPHTKRAKSPERLAAEKKGVPYSTVTRRMEVHDISFWEALEMEPLSRSEVGRIGKKRSHWSKTTPASPAEHRGRTGPIKSHTEGGDV